MHPRPHRLWRVVGGLALVALALAWVALLVRALRVAPSPTEAALVGVPVALIAWLLADLASGLVHYWADEVADERTPWLGRNIIVPFREHHADPLAMTTHGVCETNGDNALAALAILSAFGWLVPLGGPAVASFGGHVGVLVFGAGVALTNQIHKWAHARRPPDAARWLQRRGLILSPQEHRQHHRSHHRAYCVTSGWCNAALDRLLARRRPEPAPHPSHHRSSP